jgi:hypothetical protein
MTQELADIILADTKVRVPIVKHINSDLSNRLDLDSGSRVNVLAPDFGEVSDGPSFKGHEDTLNILRDKIPVDVYQRKTGKSMNQLEKALQVGNFDDAISTPISMKLASRINQHVFQAILAGAEFGIVSTTSFADLSQATAYVKTSRVNLEDGKYAGMLSPNTVAKIVSAAGAANMFQANQGLTDELYYDGEIGTFNSVEYFDSPDAGIIKYGSLPAADSRPVYAFSATASFNGTAGTEGDALNANGATTMTLSGITVGSGTIASIAAGTPIVLDGYNVCDIFGNDTGMQRIFVVGWNSADKNGAWPITSGNATVRIAQVRLAGGINPLAGSDDSPANGSLGALWAVPNTVVDPNVTVSSAATCPLYSGVSYSMGAVFAKNGAAFASATPGVLGYDSAASDLDGEINVRISRVADGFEGKEFFRVDVLYGVNQMYNQGICGLWTQLSPQLTA